MGGPDSSTSLETPEKSLKELLNEIEHSCDGKIEEEGDEEHRRGVMVFDSIDRKYTTEAYPESTAIYLKLQNRYKQLEETLGELNQKTKSWWSHPFTSIEEFNKIVEDLTGLVHESEKNLFMVIKKEAKSEGRKELRNRNYQKSLLHLTFSVTLEPKNHQLRGIRAVCFWKLDAIEEALEDLEKALEFQPNWEEGYLLIGRIYFTSGDYGKACTVYRNGLEKLPDNERLQEALRESFSADSTEKRLKFEISSLSKQLAELGIHPSDVTLQTLFNHFSERIKALYESPAPGCNQSKIVARIRALITMILHRCRFESRDVVDSYLFVKDWSSFKERMISLAMEAFFRIGALLLNDIEAVLSEDQIPIRMGRFTIFKQGVYKALSKSYLIPKIRNGRKALRGKINTLLVLCESKRDFLEVESGIFNLVEMTALQFLIVPFVSFVSSSETKPFSAIVMKNIKRADRERIIQEDSATATLRDDILHDLEGLCADLTEFKFQQELRNGRQEERTETGEEKEVLEMEEELGDD